MKIQLYRQSGAPVDLTDREGYDNDFKAFYDIASLRAGLDMLKLARFMRFGERQLTKKWNKSVEIEIPRTKKSMLALLEKYEQVPIMLAMSTDQKSVVGILMDQLQ